MSHVLKPLPRRRLQPRELSGGRPSVAAPSAEGVGRSILAPPHAAEPRRRRWFDPARGWVRLTERAASHWLSTHVYPRLPGVAIPYGHLLERNLVLSETTVRLPGWSPGARERTLLLVTDLHAGPFVRGAVLARCLERLAALGPDAILLGGDFVTARLGELDDVTGALAAMRPPDGVWAVLGNHDHYTGEAATLRRRLSAAGVGVLHNESVTLGEGAGGFHLAGVDDLLMGQPDLDAALAEVASPTVLLSHNPDVFFDAARRGVALTLAGHTHGGQIRFPGGPVLVRQSRYRLDEGRYRFGGSELIVSRGLGATGVPLRIGCAPEAVWIRLESARGAAVDVGAR